MPLPSAWKMLSKADAEKDAKLRKALDLYPYRKILGKVAYIARCTRPDVLWIVSILQQYQTNYGWRMIDTLLALVSFLYNSKEVMLTFLSGYEVFSC